MGVAESKSVAEITTNAVLNVISNQVSEAVSQIAQQQIISISGTKGNVLLEGMKFDQTASQVQSAVISSTATNELGQKITETLKQVTQSVVKDLNIAQFAKADATIKSFTNMSTELVNNIKNSCAPSMKQTQVIAVSNTLGNVEIKNQLFSQIADQMSQCVLTAVSNNKATQELQKLVDQQTSAVASGVNIWAVVIMVVAVCVVIVVISVSYNKTVGAAGDVLNKSGPIIIILIIMFVSMIGLFVTGIGFLISYNNLGDTKEDIRMYLNSPGIGVDNTCLKAQIGSETGLTIAEANNKCIKDKSCNGYDFIDKTDKGPSKTVFYRIDSDGNTCPAIDNFDPKSTITTGIKYTYDPKSNQKWKYFFGILCIILACILVVAFFIAGITMIVKISRRRKSSKVLPEVSDIITE